MKERKYYISFYLEGSLIKEIQKVVDDPFTTFDDRSQFIRYCIKQMLPRIQREIEEDKNK